MHPSHTTNITIDGNGLCHSVRVVCCWWCMCSGTSHITIGCIAHVWYIVALHTCISPYTHITHDMSATHIIIMWWVDCGTPVTSYTHTLYQSPHPIWHMQGTHHEWHVHTHQLDGASLVCIMILGVAYTHATHICVLYVYTMLKFTHRYITLSHIPNTPSHITGDTMYKCN